MNFIYKILDVQFIYNHFSQLLSCKSYIPEEWKDEIILKPKHLYLSPYGISSFYYAFAGLIMLIFFNNNFKLNPSIPIPIEVFAIMLFSQSILSYYADVIYIHNLSYWHTFDRILTIINLMLFLLNILWISNIEKVYFISIIITGFILFKKSRKARDNKNLNEFLLHHQIWHIFFPLAIVLWLCYRKIINK